MRRALLLGALASVLGPLSPAPAASAAAPLLDAPELRVVVSQLAEPATVGSRVPEARPQVAGDLLERSARTAGAARGAAAFEAQAPASTAAHRIGRWCLAHATSTQSP